MFGRNTRQLIGSPRAASARAASESIATEAEEIDVDDVYQSILEESNYCSVARAKALETACSQYVDNIEAWYFYNSSSLPPSNDQIMEFFSENSPDENEENKRGNVEDDHETMNRPPIKSRSRKKPVDLYSKIKEYEKFINTELQSDFGERSQKEEYLLQKLLEEKAKSIPALFTSYKEKVQNTEYFLHGLSNEGNETSVSMQANSQLQLDQTRFDIRYMQAGPLLSAMPRCTVESGNRYKNELLWHVSSTFSQKQNATLKQFYYYVKELFQVATPVNEDEKHRFVHSHKVKLNETRKAILGWEKNLQEKISAMNLSNRRSNRYCLGNLGNKYGKPSRKYDDETKADHPILQAIVFVIGDIISSEETDNTGQVEGRNQVQKNKKTTAQERKKDGSEITSERYLFPFCPEGVERNDTSLKSKRRRIDIMYGKNHQEYIPVTHAAMLRVPVEIKTAPYKQAELEKAVEKGVSQITGHLSKKLLVDFNFAGIGKDGSATGIVLTQHVFKVCKMTLSKTGTSEMKVDSIQTDMIRLWDEVTTQNDEGNDTILSSFHILAGALIEGSKNNETIHESSGMFLSCSQGGTHPRLGYLGSGSFANVFSVRATDHTEKNAINRKLFWKVPKCAVMEPSFTNEAKILKRLAPHGNIPVLANEKGCLTSVSVTHKKTHMVSKIRTLELRGIVGQSLRLMSTNDWNDWYGLQVIKEVILALQHAHERNILHLDLRPGNIVYEEKIDAAGISVMLIDWGCAVVKGQTWNGSFRGTVPYAHNYFFSQCTDTSPSMVTKAGKLLDYASLMYTVDHCRVGKLRWDSRFDRPTTVNGEDIAARKKCVKDSLEWICDQLIGDDGTIQDLCATIGPIMNDLYKACGFDTNKRDVRNRVNQI